MPLLSDPNQELRIEALYTLSDARELRPQHLAQALADLEGYSPELLCVAQKLLLRNPPPQTCRIGQLISQICQTKTRLPLIIKFAYIFY